MGPASRVDVLVAARVAEVTAKGAAPNLWAATAATLPQALPARSGQLGEAAAAIAAEGRAGVGSRGHSATC